MDEAIGDLEQGFYNTARLSGCSSRTGQGLCPHSSVMPTFLRLEFHFYPEGEYREIVCHREKRLLIEV